MEKIIISLFLMLPMALIIATLVVSMRWTKPVKRISLPITGLGLSLIFLLTSLSVLSMVSPGTKAITRGGEYIDRSMAAQFLVLFKGDAFYYAFIVVFAIVWLTTAFVCRKKRARLH
jgi:formate hydrogenlyase subunit 3/multisubunit Na+/H+ antiporter MnhD subunit